MSLKFHHETLGQRVLFGAGQAATHLAQEVERFQANNVMVIAGKTEAELARQIASEIRVAVWHHEVVMHVPIEVARRARQVATEHDIDLLVSVGGGSTTGTAKSVSMTTGIPSIAVPTTYAGSEATDVWGLTEQHRKTTGKDLKVLPLSVIYDSKLTLSLPVELSVASGLNALAHCVDSYWAPHADPINAALASEGIRALNQGLPLIADSPQDIAGRDLALYGAYLSAVAFASAGSGLHHKLCHILGGTFNLPHAQTHAIVLPYVLAFNIEDAPDAEQRMKAAFESDSALGGLQKLRAILDAPRALKDHGLSAENIPEVVRQALKFVPADNPRIISAENLTSLLTAALHGDDPSDLLKEKYHVNA
jgi:maleylacetate reductase